MADIQWEKDLKKQVQIIEKTFKGRIGIYIKCLKDGSEFHHRDLNYWYLASTTKVPVAYSLMKEVETKNINLKQKVKLQTSDYVDGSGEVIIKKPGTDLSLEYLLKQMLQLSDSTAADILIRQIGVDKINSNMAKITSGFGPITSLLQVRTEAYGELHPKGRHLKNTDFINFKKVPFSKRVLAFSDKVKIPRSKLNYQSLNEAFEAYYKKGLNSATLVSYGEFLEKLFTYQLLSKKSTDLIIHHMEKMKTGSRRIKAGLPQGLHFAQKTGTQIRRMCNMGWIRDVQKKSKGLIIAACVEKFTSSRSAEKAFAQLGDALVKTKSLNCLKN